MGLLNLNEPEKTDLDLRNETKEKSFRTLIIIGCILLAGGFSSFTYDSTEGDPVLRGRLMGWISHMIGATLGILAVPAIVSLISKTFTDKWEYVFGAVFLVIFVANLALRIVN